MLMPVTTPSVSLCYSHVLILCQCAKCVLSLRSILNAPKRASPLDKPPVTSATASTQSSARSKPEPAVRHDAQTARSIVKPGSAKSGKKGSFQGLDETQLLKLLNEEDHQTEPTPMCVAV
jgi:hypothetical protein